MGGVTSAWGGCSTVSFQLPWPPTLINFWRLPKFAKNRLEPRQKYTCGTAVPGEPADSGHVFRNAARVDSIFTLDSTDLFEEEFQSRRSLENQTRKHEYTSTRRQSNNKQIARTYERTRSFTRRRETQRRYDTCHFNQHITFHRNCNIIVVIAFQS